jgi:hypothetical protein
VLIRLVAVAAVIAIASSRTALGSPDAVGHQVATSGAWKASFTFVESNYRYSGLHVTVLDGSRLVLDAPVTTRFSGASTLQPGSLSRRSSISFRDLNGDGTKELVLALFTGGAHCCSIVQVFDFAGTTPKKTEIDFGDPGATLIALNGQVLFRSADDNFAYAFTDYADSAEPIELWTYNGGHFNDVTRAYPQEIGKDATDWWRSYRSALKSHGDVRGVLAAWAADEAELGHARTAKQTLLQLAFNGALDRGYGPPKGSTYVRDLWKFLAKHGYLR